MNISKDLQEIFEHNLTMTVGFSLDMPLSEYIKSSIDFIKVIVDVESKYSIEFSEDDLHLDKFVTIQDFIDGIEAKISQNV